MKNKIKQIQNEFFGDDKSKIYIREIMFSVFRDCLEREAFLYILQEASKDFHTTETRKDKNGKIIGELEGIFDKNNYLDLSNMFNHFEKAMMINLRNFLSNELGRAGKFIKYVKNISAGDIIEFYNNLREYNEDGSVKSARVSALGNNFWNKLLWKNGDFDKLKLFDINFFNSRESELETIVKALKLKAQKWESKEYYKKIVHNYENIFFHNDHNPEKFDVKITKGDKWGFKFTHTSRSHKAKIEAQLFPPMMNELSEIFMIYSYIIPTNTVFGGSYFTTRNYSDKIFDLFKIEIPNKTKEKVFNENVKYFEMTINLFRMRKK